MLSSGQDLDYNLIDENLVIAIPVKSPDPINTVIVAEIEGDAEVISNMPAQDEEGNISLPVRLGFLHNPGYGEHAKLSRLDADGFVTNWVEKRTRIEWMFKANQSGEFTIHATYAGKYDNMMSFESDDQSASYPIANTGTMDTFIEAELGTIEIKESGDQVMTMRPAGDDWTGINLKSIKLILSK